LTKGNGYTERGNSHVLNKGFNNPLRPVPISFKSYVRGGNLPRVFLREKEFSGKCTSLRQSTRYDKFLALSPINMKTFPLPLAIIKVMLSIAPGSPSGLKKMSIAVHGGCRYEQ
jgi:hypothetical protein